MKWVTTSWTYIMVFPPISGVKILQGAYITMRLSDGNLEIGAQGNLFV